MVNSEDLEKINFLNSAIEKIVFNKESLGDLKRKIEEFFVSGKKSSSKELKQIVANYLMSIFNNLLNFLPYYLKDSSNQRASSIEHNTSSVELKKLKSELMEKDAFLEELGSIIDDMYEKVEKKL